jgi:hypothetical protein
MTPAWNSVEFTATALGNASTGTRFGVIACPVGIQKARPQPNSNIARKTGQMPRWPESVNHSSSAAQQASTM